MKTTIVYRKPVDAMIDVPYAEGHYRFWEKRMHLDDIFEELALPWNTDADVVDIANTIIRFCKTARIMPTNVSWDVKDNVLYMNDTPLRRVGPSHAYDYVVDDEADYWEARCLSMGEPVD